MFDTDDKLPIRRTRVMHRRRAVELSAMLIVGLASRAVVIHDAAAARKTKKRKKGKQDQAADGSGTDSGSDVAKEAQKHEGAKYTWGGASPKGFDCSGFTWYVYNRVTGMDIGRTEEDQWKLGDSVGRGDLSPGDLVFFKNTFERGLSHVGISLGGTKFIHAENEGTGVVVSNLDSGYYADHYAGARRLL